MKEEIEIDETISKKVIGVKSGNTALIPSPPLPQDIPSLKSTTLANSYDELLVKAL